MKEFLDLIQDFSESDIQITKHTFFRLAQGQRNIYKDLTIKLILGDKGPDLVGIQNNNLYACFYKHQSKIYRIILDIKPSKIMVVTFYIVDNIPKILK